MAGRREQPPRAAKNKSTTTVEVVTRGARSPPRVTKSRAPKKAAPKKAPSQKKKAPLRKHKAPASSKRRSTPVDRARTDEDESDTDATNEEALPSQAAGTDERAGSERDVSLGREDRPGVNAGDDDADNTGAAAVVDPPSGGPPEDAVDDSSYEETLDRLPALATADSHAECTFGDNAAELTLSLKVFAHPSNVSRLGYYAKLQLTIDDADATDPASDGNAIGFLHAWRISKTTSALPQTNKAWLEEILSADEKDADMKETSNCLSALFTEDGSTRPVVGTHAAQLENNPLMFIESIYIKPDFQRRGLLDPAFDCFYRALAQLPEWFAFAGTLVLVPAPLENNLGKSWGSRKDATVEKILTKVYSNRGFDVWVKNGAARGLFLTVMARSTPEMDESDIES